MGWYFLIRLHSKIRASISVLQLMYSNSATCLTMERTFWEWEAESMK